MDCSRPGLKERSIPTAPGKDKCTNPTEPSCLILDLTVVFNLILSFLLSLPYLLSSTCILQPDLSPSSVFPSPGENAFNAREPVRSWEVHHGAQGLWHGCIPSSALSAVSCDGSPVEEVLPDLNGSFTKAEAA